MSRALERDGILTRTVHTSAPVRIDYQLTALGISLLEPVAALRAWAIDHLGDVVEARESHDALPQSRQSGQTPAL